MAPRDLSRGRRPRNATARVFGLVFCGAALGWLLIAVGALSVRDLHWLLPTVLIAAGVVGVVTSVRTGRRRD